MDDGATGDKGTARKAGRNKKDRLGDRDVAAEGPVAAGRAGTDERARSDTPGHC